MTEPNGERGTNSGLLVSPPSKNTIVSHGKRGRVSSPYYGGSPIARFTGFKMSGYVQKKLVGSWLFRLVTGVRSD
jgi:hypothetical protein